MKKPKAADIRAAIPLTKGELRPADPLTACNICGRESDPLLLEVWREHDERDQPIQGTRALVVLAAEHKDCRKVLDAHPRLYAEETGNPGHFPKLCGPCTFRDGMTCTHPDAKANGGAGLYVEMTNHFAGAILCGRHGRIRPVHRALTCKGRALRTLESP